MPSRLTLLLPVVSALALSLACGGSSNPTPIAPKQTSAPVDKKVPVTDTPATARPLAFDPLAITCAPGDPILLLPSPGALGDGRDSAGFKLEGKDVETGKSRSITPMNMGNPGQSTFACGRASDAAGTTHLQIRAQVGETWTAPRTLAVTVQPVDPASVLRVAPSAATVAPGGRILFKGYPSKVAGETASTTAFATAAAGSGTISPVGKGLYLYEAPKTPGTYQLVMTHIPDGARVQVQVTVAQPAS